MRGLSVKQGSTPRVLVVEGRSDVAAELDTRLRDSAIEVVGVANDASSAIHLAEEHRPDLALLAAHVEKPGDGSRVAASLQRKLEIGIFFVVDDLDSSTRKVLGESDAYGLVHRPFTNDELAAAVTMALHRHRLHLERQRQSEQNAYLAKVLEGLPDAVVVVDQHAAIKHLNPAAQRMFAIDWHADASLELDDLIPEDRREIHRRNVERFSKGSTQLAAMGNRFAGIEGRRSDGSTFPAEATLVRLRSGSEPCVAAIVRDLTEMRRLERERDQALKLEAAGRLAAVMAHDFNNLLASLLLEANTLLSSLPNESESRRSAVEIVKAVEYGRALTSRLADVNRPDQGARVWVDLSSELDRLRSFVTRLLGDAIAVIWRVDASLGRARLLRGELAQVIMNCAANARDAMPQGGSFVLRATATAPLPDSGAPTFARIEVLDTGHGIGNEVLDRAFDPFVTTKAGGGSGLGLASVKSSIENAGGHVELVSSPEQGTTLTMYLPVRPAPAALTDDQPRAEAARPSLPSTVLVVDDQAAVRRSVAKALQTLGHETLVAATAGEALMLLEQEGDRIAAILTDVAMPIMNGIELCTLVERSYPNVRAILMTGDLEGAPAGPRSSQRVHLIKPFNLDELESALGRALRGASR